MSMRSIIIRQVKHTISLDSRANFFMSSGRWLTRLADDSSAKVSSSSTELSSVANPLNTSTRIPQHIRLLAYADEHRQRVKITAISVDDLKRRTDL
jgi:hypothetical protein